MRIFIIILPACSAFTNNNAAFGGVISIYDSSLLSPAVILLTTVQVTMVVSWTHLTNSTIGFTTNSAGDSGGVIDTSDSSFIINVYFYKLCNYKLWWCRTC